ncbi:sensor histidine kinase N-terminal domain-containing protein [Alphaproteobacteria bacterium]|nr:sensor histidine kinase N-terminal domain-containing protein [Alphaproteobacteria bacterium]
MSSNNFSIKNRLLLQLATVATILIISFFFTIKSFIGNTVISTQDGLLSASLGSIIKKIRVEQGEIYIDLPYDTFSILGSMKDDKVYYRFDLNKKFLTGYEDLPKREIYGDIREPNFETIIYRGETIRLANIKKNFNIKNKELEILITLGQTQNFQKSINNDVTKNMIIIFVLFSFVIIFLVIITTNYTIRPLNSLARQLSLRGPKDLRIVKYKAPIELKPLVQSLNGLIQRFRGNLIESESFLAEAAHHIRTPLATVKAECELAIRKSKNDKNRNHLLNIIRSVEQTNRSSSHAPSHKVIVYRLDLECVSTRLQ